MVSLNNKFEIIDDYCDYDIDYNIDNNNTNNNIDNNNIKDIDNIKMKVSYHFYIKLVLNDIQKYWYAYPLKNIYAENFIPSLKSMLLNMVDEYVELEIKLQLESLSSLSINTNTTESKQDQYQYQELNKSKNDDIFKCKLVKMLTDDILYKVYSNESNIKAYIDNEVYSHLYRRIKELLFP